MVEEPGQQTPDSGKQNTTGRGKKPWSKEEDEVIVGLVTTYGTNSWTKISKELNDMQIGLLRSGKQCRTRWINHLNPEIKTSPWSPEEVATIAEMQKQVGNKWSEIAKKLPGRTDNSIKNYWYSMTRRKLRKTAKDVAKIVKIMQTEGFVPQSKSAVVPSTSEAPKAEKVEGDKAAGAAVELTPELMAWVSKLRELQQSEDAAAVLSEEALVKLSKDLSEITETESGNSLYRRCYSILCSHLCGGSSGMSVKLHVDKTPNNGNSRRSSGSSSRKKQIKVNTSSALADSWAHRLPHRSPSHLVDSTISALSGGGSIFNMGTVSPHKGGDFFGGDLSLGGLGMHLNTYDGTGVPHPQISPVRNMLGHGSFSAPAPAPEFSLDVVEMADSLDEYFSEEGSGSSSPDQSPGHSGYNSSNDTPPTTPPESLASANHGDTHAFRSAELSPTDMVANTDTLWGTLGATAGLNALGGMHGSGSSNVLNSCRNVLGTSSKSRSLGLTVDTEKSNAVEQLPLRPTFRCDNRTPYSYDTAADVHVGGDDAENFCLTPLAEVYKAHKSLVSSIRVPLAATTELVKQHEQNHQSQKSRKHADSLSLPMSMDVPLVPISPVKTIGSFSAGSNFENEHCHANEHATGGSAVGGSLGGGGGVSMDVSLKLGFDLGFGLPSASDAEPAPTRIFVTTNDYHQSPRKRDTPDTPTHQFDGSPTKRRARASGSGSKHFGFDQGQMHVKIEDSSGVVDEDGLIPSPHSITSKRGRVRKPSTKGKSLACVGAGSTAGCSASRTPMAQVKIGSWQDAVGQCVWRVGDHSERCAVVVRVMEEPTQMIDSDDRNRQLQIRYPDGEQQDVAMGELEVAASAVHSNGYLTAADPMNALASHMQQLSSQSPSASANPSQDEKHFLHFFQRYGTSAEQYAQEQKIKQQHERRKAAARKRMQAENINQLQLAQMLGLSQPMISKWVNSACSSKVVHEKLSAWLSSSMPEPLQQQ